MHMYPWRGEKLYEPYSLRFRSTPSQSFVRRHVKSEYIVDCCILAREYNSLPFASSHH